MLPRGSNRAEAAVVGGVARSMLEFCLIMPVHVYRPPSNKQAVQWLDRHCPQAGSVERAPPPIAAAARFAWRFSVCFCHPPLTHGLPLGITSPLPSLATLPGTEPSTAGPTQSPSRLDPFAAGCSMTAGARWRCAVARRKRAGTISRRRRCRRCPLLRSTGSDPPIPLLLQGASAGRRTAARECCQPSARAPCCAARGRCRRCRPASALGRAAAQCCGSPPGPRRCPARRAHPLLPQVGQRGCAGWRSSSRRRWRPGCGRPAAGVERHGQAQARV